MKIPVLQGSPNADGSTTGHHDTVEAALGA